MTISYSFCFKFPNFAHYVSFDFFFPELFFFYRSVWTIGFFHHPTVEFHQFFFFFEAHFWTLKLTHWQSSTKNCWFEFYEMQFTWNLSFVSNFTFVQILKLRFEIAVDYQQFHTIFDRMRCDYRYENDTNIDTRMRLFFHFFHGYGDYLSKLNLNRDFPYTSLQLIGTCFCCKSTRRWENEEKKQVSKEIISLWLHRVYILLLLLIWFLVSTL